MVLSVTSLCESEQSSSGEEFGKEDEVLLGGLGGRKNNVPFLLEKRKEDKPITGPGPSDRVKMCV